MKYGMIGLAVAATYYGAIAPATRRMRHHHDDAPARERQGTSWSWRGTLAEGRTLEVRGISGDVDAEAATGNEIEVTADKRGRRDDPEDVRIEVVEHAGGVTICAVYPGRDNHCSPGGGRMNVRNNDVEVRFRVKVPRGVRFEGNTVNGDIAAAGLSSPVELNTVNGSVRLETTSGEASAHTVNGGITAVVTGPGSGVLDFETVNGGIDVTLPRSLGADLEAATVNGAINTDFAVQVMGRMTPRRLAGRIGEGGRKLELSTVNGSIRLRPAQ